MLLKAYLVRNPVELKCSPHALHERAEYGREKRVRRLTAVTLDSLERGARALSTVLLHYVRARHMISSQARGGQGKALSGC